MKNRRPSAILPVPFGLDDARRFDDGFAKSNANERKTKSPFNRRRSCVDGTAVRVGDSIAAVTLRKTKKGGGGEGLSDFEQVDSIATECFGYDKTVEALMSLPPPEGEGEVIVLTLKRLL